MDNFIVVLVIFSILSFGYSWKVNINRKSGSYCGRSPYSKQTSSSRRIRVYGVGDFFGKILANDSNLPPVSDPGLKKERIPVTIEFLPSKKTVQAFPGTPLSQAATTAATL